MLARGVAVEEPFIARAVELRRLREWLASSGRLLTIRGAPGVGKSRLAYEGSGRESGLLRCDLFGAVDLDEMKLRLARALEVAAGADVVEALRARTSLLVLDNLQRPGDEVADWVGELIAGTRILVTAREALRIEGEQLLDLGPLVLADEAVHLLRLRSASAGADLSGASPETLRAIVAALDGLPLALELAAAQLAHLAADQLLERLPVRLELLVRAPCDVGFLRHHDLHEAIEASWRLLSPGEHRALAQLTIFRGGFSIEAAEAVLERDVPIATTIRALRERSLLQLRDAASERYAVDESVRLFAARQLDAAERAAAERRHAAFFLGAADQWRQALETRSCLDAAAQLEREQENLLEIHRRSLVRASYASDGASDALHAALALEPLFHLRQNARGLLDLLDAGLVAASPSKTEPLLRAEVLLARGKARLFAGRPAGALADLLEAVGLARAAGDTHLEARTLLQISRAHREQGRDDASRLSCERAISLLEGGGPDRLLGQALGTRGLLAHERGELDDARAWYEKSREVHLRSGDRRGWAIVTGTLGNLLFDRGQIEEARERITAAIAVFHEFGDEQNHAALRDSLAAIHQEAGAFELACAEYASALALLSGSGRRRLEAQIMGSLAGAHLEAGRIEDARRIYEQALAMLREFGDARNEGLVLLPFALLLAGEERLGEAEELVDRAEQLLRGVDDPNNLAVVVAARGVIAARRARELFERGANTHALGLVDEARRSLQSAREGAGASERGRLVLRMLEATLGNERTVRGAGPRGV